MSKTSYRQDRKKNKASFESHYNANRANTNLEVLLRQRGALNVTHGAQFTGHGAGIVGRDGLLAGSVQLNEHLDVMAKVTLGANENKRRYGASSSFGPSSTRLFRLCGKGASNFGKPFGAN